MPSGQWEAERLCAEEREGAAEAVAVQHPASKTDMDFFFFLREAAAGQWK